MKKCLALLCWLTICTAGTVAARNDGTPKADVSENSDSVYLKHRQLITDFIGRLQTAYEQRDIAFLEPVFNGSTLIVSERGVRALPDDNLLRHASPDYLRGNLNYLQQLHRVFGSQRDIRIEFSEIRIQRHPVKSAIYGTQARIGYDTSVYSDDGYLFMLWDFSDDSYPMIHFQIWQPYYQDAEKTRIIAPEDILSIVDFEI